MSNVRTLLTSVFAAASLMACGVGADGEVQVDGPGDTSLSAIRQDSAPDDGVLKIREGDVTTERPEVGRISGCTATLVAPDVAITASHCLGYRSRLGIGRYDTFRIDGDGETHRYTVNRYRSFGRDLGRNDIALVGLAEMVPPEVALPAPIAIEVPVDGVLLSVWGYGCTRIGGGIDGRKRVAEFEQGETSYRLCPGDSGGPVFNDETGEVLRINSGYMLDRGRSDIHGVVPGLYDELLEQIEAWTEGEVPQAGVVPDGIAPDAQICGRTVDTFESWTCTPSRGHRYRCLPGGAPTWQLCASGCVSGAKGLGDTCAAGDSPDLCGDTYRRFEDWSCATDDTTLLRCEVGRLEVLSCEAGCSAIAERADACD